MYPIDAEQTINVGGPKTVNHIENRVNNKKYSSIPEKYMQTATMYMLSEKNKFK